MKKIIFVSNTAWSIYNFRIDLIKYLEKNNYDVIVIAPYDDSVEKIKEICTYINIKLDRKGINVFNDLKFLYRLFKLYIDLDPDIIFHYTIKPNIYGSIASKFANKTSVAVVTGLGYSFIKENLITKISKLLYKISLKHSNEVWFLNKEDFNQFLEMNLIKKEKGYILKGEGINTDKYSPDLFKKKLEPKNNIKFLLIGRMIYDKGVKEFVNAAKIIKKRYKNVKFELLGPIDYDYSNSIDKETLLNWNKDKSINYLGETDDVRKYINQSDCVVLPSYREGVPRTLLEAASMETPLIATDVPGCRDVIDNNVNGFLCKVEDYKDLANKMEIFINLSKIEKKIMGKKGRKKVKKEFDIDIIIEKYLNAINRLLDN